MDDDRVLFQDAIETQAQIYLLSISNMNRPLQDIEILSTILEKQWKLLDRGKQSLVSKGTIHFLQKEQIEGHGLRKSLVRRVNLATFAHDMFALTLDLERVKSGLNGLIYLFVGENPMLDQSLLTIFSQLVAVILVLHTKVSPSSALLSPNDVKEHMQTSCTYKTIPELQMVSNMDEVKVVNLAMRVYYDDKHLMALYDNILKRIAIELTLQMKSLAPIDKKHMKDIITMSLRERNKILKNTLKEERDSSSSDLEDFINRLPSPKQLTQSKTDDSSTDQSMPDIEQDINAIVSEDEDLEADVNTDVFMETRETYVDPQESAEGTMNSKGRSVNKQRLVNIRAIRTKNTMHHAATSSPTAKATRRTSPDQEAIQEHGETSPTTTSSSSSYEESEEESTSPPLKRRKRAISESKVKKNGTAMRSKQRETSSSRFSAEKSGSSPSSTHKAAIQGHNAEQTDDQVDDQSTLIRKDTSASISNSIPEPKTRKPTVHWTKEEVDRLMELVEMFKYDESEIKVRKRTIKWAQLKQYDSAHGDVLKARSQVQLKDKYREQTDNGRHSEYVQELNRMRFANNKKA